MDVQINTLVLGPLQTNSYVIRSGGACWVVDPGIWPAPLLEHLEQLGIAPGRILVTHGHYDHVAGVAELQDRWPGAVFTCPAADADMPADPMKNMSGVFGLPMEAPEPQELLEPGRELSCGSSTWRVLDTAGHTPGGVSYYCEPAGTVLAGDALFAGGVGRTDIPRADHEQLIASIRQNLLSLPGTTKVFPGHGPATTIERETASNPFLQRLHRDVDTHRGSP